MYSIMSNIKISLLIMGICINKACLIIIKHSNRILSGILLKMSRALTNTGGLQGFAHRLTDTRQLKSIHCGSRIYF